MMHPPVTQEEVSATGVVKAAPGALCGVVLTAGSTAATLTLHDNTAASGPVVLTLKAAANSSVTWTPIAASSVGTGLYATLTGTSPTAYVAHW